MSDRVESTVANYLEASPVDWDILKPVVCFVVLWNRLEEEHKCASNLGKLKSSCEDIARSKGFLISRYSHPVDFVRKRYQCSPELRDDLFKENGEPEVKEQVIQLISGKLKAVLMIPYRIRNNLFHGRKQISKLPEQTEVFRHVNEVLSTFLGMFPSSTNV